MVMTYAFCFYQQQNAHILNFQKWQSTFRNGKQSAQGTIYVKNINHFTNQSCAIQAARKTI